MRMRVSCPTLRGAILGAASTLALLTSAPAFGGQAVEQTNLVTDDQAFLASEGFAPAVTEDPDLINPWGVSFAPTGPFWVSNQGSDNATLYNGAGAKQGLTVAIAFNAMGPHGPTGQLFNPTNSFILGNGSKGLFFFANLDGSISGWNPAAGPNALVVVSSHPGAIYTGLAQGSSGGQDFLYAANNLTGTVDVYDSSFMPVTLPGGFADPGAPAGFAPFNVANIGGQIWVTYATGGPDADEQPLGSGFVSVFNPDGSFVRRFATGGNMISPWGMTVAPASFGTLGGAVLIGNFSDENGFINAFNASDGAFLGSLLSSNGGPLNIPYLWSLTFGNGGNGGNPNLLYFSAGIGDEEHGLFGSLAAVPEPAEWAMLLSGFGLIGAALRRRKGRPLPI